MTEADAEGSPTAAAHGEHAGGGARTVDGTRRGLPERSGASLRALLREGMTRPGRSRVHEMDRVGQSSIHTVVKLLLG